MDDMLRQYEDQGYIGPLQAFSADEMASIEHELRSTLGESPALPDVRNRHLDWPLAEELCTHPAIVDSLRALMGEDLIVWRSNIFSVGGGKGLPWHQDEYHTLLEQPFNHITVHMAISAADADNCLMIIPGSHKYRVEDMESHGFLEIPGSRDYAALGTPRFHRMPDKAPQPVRLTLQPGEFIVFHPSLMHGSDDNVAVDRRGKKPGLLRRMASRIKRLLGRHPAATPPADKPSRLAIGIRVTVPGNRTKPAAFAETAPRDDKCVVLTGTNNNGVNELGCWASDAA